MAREVPLEFANKMRAWGRWTSVWHWVHYTTGFSAAAISVVVAANAKAQFLSSLQATLVAALAAGLSFLLTAFTAQTKAKGFELAYRTAEEAEAQYQLDSSLSEKFLADAIKRGIRILNDVR